ncbi:hypothetical protein CEXT_65401 [Caerostris extrusa]|uniref:Uncharacterized protein n=1 Tax=Caerostris extrusa TaxID=172846 RepID=A0AAV4V2U4_CAEEX|nr:hypothetical protein CEXT_65401 [Caerostris extrusa]
MWNLLLNEYDISANSRELLQLFTMVVSALPIKRMDLLDSNSNKAEGTVGTQILFSRDHPYFNLYLSSLIHSCFNGLHIILMALA